MRNVLIADDHEVIRRGVKQLLLDNFEGVSVFEATNVASVLAQIGAEPWDLIVLDLMMPGGNILDLLRDVRAINKSVPVLILTAAMETAYVRQTMKAGATGFIQKHRACEELVAAIRVVTEGKFYLHSETAATLAADLCEAQLHDSLSARELEIFLLIARGESIKEIAAQLGLSDKTVATYLARIREKTGLDSHVDIARYALQHGLVN